MHVSDASMRNNRISAPEFLNRYCALATLTPFRSCEFELIDGPLSLPTPSNKHEQSCDGGNNAAGHLPSEQA
jgi:hypothetical protein